MSRGGDVYSKVVETFEGGHVTSFVVSLSAKNVHVNPFILKKREREAKRTEDERERGKGGGEVVGLRGKSSQYFTGSQNQKTGKTETIN